MQRKKKEVEIKKHKDSKIIKQTNENLLWRKSSKIILQCKRQKKTTTNNHKAKTIP